MPKRPVVLSSSATKVDFESDCACSTHPRHFVPDHLELVENWSYKINNEFCKKQILPDFSIYYSLKNPSGIVVLDTLAESILNRFYEPKKINAVEDVLSCDHEEEYQTIIKLINNKLLISADALSPDQILHEGDQLSEELTVWLHITNQCNLRCEYCFVDKTIHKMSVDTVEKSIDAIFRSAQYNAFKGVKIKYAGGEPTLNFKVLQHAHEYAKDKFANSEITVKEIILTNATHLNPEMVDYLKDNSIQVMVSLDGLGVDNDVQRHTLSGRGSFQNIDAGLKLLASREILPTISITISNKNCQAVPELTRWLLAQELPFTFNFYRENQFSANIEDLAINDASIINSLLLAYNEIESNPPSYSILDMLSDRAQLSASHSHTCGVGSSYLVIGHNGQVSKCHMLLHQPITTIYTENPLRVVRNDIESIQNPSVESKLECNKCDWRYVCTGGCPALTYRATGRFDVKSPNCNIYKSIFPRILEVEAIRLLKRENYC